MIDLGSVQFVSGWALGLLLALPAWWIWRRRRERPAIVFSRTAVLAAGPRAGRAITFTLFLLRNLLLAAGGAGPAPPRGGARAEDTTPERSNTCLAVRLSYSTRTPHLLPYLRLD